MLLGWTDHLQCNELETALLETLDDFSDETALNTVRLDSNERTLSVGHFNRWQKLKLNEQIY